MQENDSNFLYHTHCDSCGSSDANSVYDDGHTYCFSCNTLTKGAEELKQQTNKEGSTEFISGEVKELSKSFVLKVILYSEQGTMLLLYTLLTALILLLS